MITLDSNKIEAPSSVLRSFNDSGIARNYSVIDGEVLKDTFTINGLGAGFNYFEYNTKKETVILSTSAKILGDDYLRGISINNIERVIDEVNTIGRGKFELDRARVIDEGRFLSIDTTNNVEISQHPYSYLEAFRSYKSSIKYKTDFHNEKDNQGIVYQGRQKSFKERLIFYNKFIELTQKSDNATFLKGLNNPVRMLDECKKILRVEQNSVQLRKIRERLNIGQSSVLAVLESPMKVNYNLAMKIIKGAEQLSIFDDLGNFTRFSDFEKYKGQESIIKECGYDLDVISDLMKHFYSEGTNYSRQLREYRNLVFTILEKERISKGGDSNLVDEVLNLLKAS